MGSSGSWGAGSEHRLLRPARRGLLRGSSGTACRGTGTGTGRAARLRARADTSAVGGCCVPRHRVPAAALEPVSGRILAWDCAEAADAAAIHHPCEDHLPLPTAPPA